MKKRYTLEEIKKVKDPKNYPVYLRPVMWPSPYISWFFLRFLPFITPNQISFLWEAIILVGMFLIAKGGYWNFLIGIIIYHIGVCFDSVDGDIARIIKKTTMGGVYLDKFFSWINRSLLLVVLGIGLYNAHNQIIYFYLGIFAGLVLIVDNFNKLKVNEAFIEKKRFDLLKEFYGKEGKPAWKGTLSQKIKFYVKMLLVPIHPFSFLFFAMVFNVSQYYLILMAIIVPVVFVRNFIGIYKKIGNLPS